MIEKNFRELREEADLENISINNTYIKIYKVSVDIERVEEENNQNRKNAPQKNQCIEI